MDEPSPTLTTKYFEEFPSRQHQYDRIHAELKAKGFPELTFDGLLDEVSRELLDGRNPGDISSELRSLIAFVNTQYDLETRGKTILGTAFISRLPDPGVDTELAALLSPEVRASLDKKWDWRSHPDGRDLVNKILTTFTQLEPLAKDLTYGREQDILTTSFMTNVAHHAVENVIAGTPDKISETNQILAHLETKHGKKTTPTS